MSTTTSVDVPELGQQLGLIQSLNNILIQFQEVNNVTLQSLQSQADIFQRVAGVYSNFENTSQQLTQNFEQLHKTLTDISQKKLNTKIRATNTKELEKISDRVLSTTDKLSEELKKDSKKQIEQSKDLGANLRENDVIFEKSIKEQKLETNNINEASLVTKFLNQKIEKFKENFYAAGGGTSLSNLNPYVLTYNIVKGAISIVFNLFTSVIAFLSDFVKLTISLPFTLASFANKIGIEFRRKIEEEIGNATESFKETVSFNSYSGRNIENLSKQVTSSLSNFTILNERITQIFGYEGEQKVLEEAKNILSGIGMFSEVFSKNLSSIDNILYLKEAQNYLGIGIQELNYYALNAYVNVEKINEQLHKAMTAISKTSKKFNIDSKSISSLYHKLRLNIEDFGHFSEFELSEMSAKLIKLRVKTEDVTGIFSKISTFESAADVSTKLFQSFGALIDAYDLLTAEDPAQMIKMLRDGMFKTGKQFSSLNRHEKQLMQQVTGLSAETLNSVMNFNDMSMSQEEIRQKLNSEDPIGLQLKTTKELVNSIKTLKKVLDFNSPFEAIFKGLMGNIAYQKNTIKITQIYSDLLENINQTMRQIDPKLIQRITLPIIILLDKFQKYIFDGRFINLIKNGLTTISDFIQGIFTISTKSKIDDIVLKYKAWYSKITDDPSKKQFENEILGKIQTIYSDKKHPLNDLINDLISSKFLIKDKDGTLSLGTNIDFKTLLSQFVSISSKNEELGHKIIQTLLITNHGEGTRFVYNMNNIDLTKTILDDLTSGIKDMIKEGQPLFEGIYNIGISIISAMVKSFMIGSTAFINAITGKISETLTYFGERGLNFETFTGIRIEEFEKMSTNLAEELGRSIIIIIPHVFDVVWKTLKESAGAIFNIFRDLLLNNLSDAIESDELNTGEKILLSTLVENKKFHYQRELKALNKRLVPYYNIRNRLEKEWTNKSTIGQIFWSDDYHENENSISPMEKRKKELKELIIEEEKKEKEFNIVKSANDLSFIKIDDKDKIELIASKDTGLLMTSYDMIKEKYDQVINNTNIKIENNKFNNNINNSEEENELLCLIDKIGNFIDNNYNKNIFDNIKINKLQIIT